MKRWQGDDSLMFVFLKAVTLLLVLVLTTHLLACIWAFTAVSEATSEVFNPDSWPVRYLGYTEVRELASSRAYIHALYWSVITVTTVGYGDRTPVTDGEIIITIMSACSGVRLLSFVFSSLFLSLSLSLSLSLNTHTPHTHTGIRVRISHGLRVLGHLT